MSFHYLSKNRPFGFIKPNGMNFVNSITNPKSVIRRLLNAVADTPLPLMRSEILRKMGYRINRKSVYIMNKREVVKDFQYNSKTGSYIPAVYKVVGQSRRKITTNTPQTTRGYLSSYFSGAHQAGFITPIRKPKSNMVVWVKGPNFPSLAEVK